MPRRANGPSPHRKRKKTTICVVDDDRSLLRAIDRLLSMSGFRVVTFASPDELFSSDRWMKAACLVMDMRLGRTSGIEVHRRLTAIGLRAPVVFITAYDDSVSREQAMLAGAAAYLPKPFPEGSLAATVRRVVGEE